MTCGLVAYIAHKQKGFRFEGGGVGPAQGASGNGAITNKFFIFCNPDIVTTLPT